MTQDELRDRLLALRWSQRGSAEALNLHPTTIRRWATGATIIPDNVGVWLDRLTIHHKQFPVPDGRFETNGSGIPSTERGTTFESHRQHKAARCQLRLLGHLCPLIPAPAEMEWATGRNGQVVSARNTLLRPAISRTCYRR